MTNFDIEFYDLEGSPARLAAAGRLQFFESDTISWTALRLDPLAVDSPS